MNIIRPTKAGQIVQYSQPVSEEEEVLFFEVVELHTEGIERAHIRAINANLALPPIEIVKLSDLKVIEIENS